MHTEGINIYRIYAGKYNNNMGQVKNQYINLAYRDPNPDLNFGLYMENLLDNVYGDREIAFVAFSNIDGKIVANIYLIEDINESN